MSIEQNLTGNVQEKIITNQSVQEVNLVEIVGEEDKQVKVEEKAQKEKEKGEQIAKVEEDLMKQFEEKESKEQYPDGHILNSNTLDKVAQLEAIDSNTGEFSQQRYDDYINSQSTLERHSVGENQRVIRESMLLGKEFDRSLRNTEIIYGEGGMNRYGIDIRSGTVKLLRGSSNTSGSPDYKTKLAQKAKELGFIVEGQ